ncbi:hypothetical protein ACFL27_06470 [candidate division CSSED10-310 bacterium]|uniref:DUF4426 domain-containing protein n=1 Tax=candidate division CSSED10-310 bacterium TaxID=2855610 RepID=A0ABV6YUF8_UNCC1
MRKYLILSMTGIIIFMFVCSATAFISTGMTTTLKLEHMKGMLLINGDRIRSIFYLEHNDPASVFLKIIYDGNLQGKKIKGTKATAVWQSMKKNKSFSERFLWVSHLKGTLGIPFQSIQSFFYTAAVDTTPARLRIIYDADTKVVEGSEAETIWKSLQQ